MYYSRLRGIVYEEKYNKSIYIFDKRHIDYRMIKIVEKQPYIVFSAEFRSGDKGTYKYSVGKKSFEKISEDILQELSYSED